MIRTSVFISPSQIPPSNDSVSECSIWITTDAFRATRRSASWRWIAPAATSPRCGRSASFPACASSIAAAIISRGSTCANAPDLQKLDCGDNEITSLDIDGLRGLTQLDCAENLLARLDLKSNSSLRSLDCRGNLLVTLDLPPCSGQLQADTRDNPFLTTVYCLASQGVDRNGPTEVVVR
ncbi:MAG: hypothetical protein ACLSAM_13455 [Alistipes onderdonkii]